MKFHLLSLLLLSLTVFAEEAEHPFVIKRAYDGRIDRSTLMSETRFTYDTAGRVVDQLDYIPARDGSLYLYRTAHSEYDALGLCTTKQVMSRDAEVPVPKDPAKVEETKAKYKQALGEMEKKQDKFNKVDEEYRCLQLVANKDKVEAFSKKVDAAEKELDRARKTVSQIAEQLREPDTVFHRSTYRYLVYDEEGGCRAAVYITEKDSTELRYARANRLMGAVTFNRKRGRLLEAKEIKWVGPDSVECRIIRHDYRNGVEWRYRSHEAVDQYGNLVLLETDTTRDESRNS